MPILDELATYLEANLNAPTWQDGVNVFKSILPSGTFPNGPKIPDVALALFEYGGRIGDYTLDNPGVAYEHPRVQIVARAGMDDYATARANCYAAYVLLGQVKNQTLSGVWYVGLTPLQPPFLLRRDANGRPEVAFNVEAFKAVS